MKQISFEKVVRPQDAHATESVVSFVCEPTSGNFLMKFEGRELSIANAFYMSFAGVATEAITIGMPVMITGIADGKLQVSRLDVMVAGFNADMMLGIATATAVQGATVYVRMFGEVPNLRLNYEANTLLWANPTTPGTVTNVKPTDAPTILVGRVIKQSSSQNTYDGILLTKPSFMTSLADLFDAEITTPQIGDSLYYDGTKWVNKRVSSVNVSGQEPTSPVANDLWIDINQ